MTSPPIPDRARSTPCPAGFQSIDGLLAADSLPVRSRHRTHPEPPHPRLVVTRPVTGPATVRTRTCFSRSRVEMPPPRVSRHARPTGSGGGGISALPHAETRARRPTRTDQVAEVGR